MKKLFASLLAVALLAGCGASGNDEKTIRIGASTTPHAEILKHIQPVLEKEGYTLEITEFSDYNKPNQALLDGELDANYFQHKDYMTNWFENANASNKVSAVFTVHFEPIGIYSVKHTTLEDIKDGTKIAIPNDLTNGGRALKLLEDHGIIKLKAGKEINATKADIESYTIKVDIIELQAEVCAANIQDVDYAIVNGNNALNANISDNVIVTEAKDGNGAKNYGNVIAVQSAHKDDEKIKALINALNSEDVKKFIEETYKGIVIPLVPTK